MRQYRHYFRLVTLTLLVFVSFSCTTLIKEAERDRDSIYRGFWSAQILDTPSQSLAGTSRTNCWNLDGNGNIEIAGGRVVARVDGYDLAGFIKPDGDFTAVLDLSGQWVFRLRGQLNSETGKGEGLLTHNRKSEGLAGCTSKVEYKKETF